MQREYGYLQQIPIFAELAAADLQKIAAISRERTYKKGAIIFAEGEQGEAVFYIKTGKVKITRTSRDGKEYIAAILGPGEIFAEAVLFNDTTYPATAEALEEAVVGMIKNSDLEEMVKGNANLALQLIKVLSRKLLNAQHRIRELALGDVLGRTAATLLKLMQQYGRQTPRGVSIHLDLSRQDLGNLIGATRETVTRTLSQLRREQVIEVDQQRLVILNPVKLREYAERQE